MAYNNFTLNKLKEDFGLEQRKVAFLPPTIPKFDVSKRLLDELSDALGMPLASEKAKSEMIVTPILMELRRKNKTKISIFSGYTFDVDKAQKLTGRCDFMIANQPYLEEVNAPMVCMVEAKNDLIESGFGQCAAEMYAASLFNQENQQQIKNIYGAVTNGYEWVFMKYTDNNVIIDQKRYFLSDVSIILHILGEIINENNF